MKRKFIYLKSNPDDVLVPIRGDLFTEVIQHLIEEFNPVVHLIQGSVRLCNFLGPYIVL